MSPMGESLSDLFRNLPKIMAEVDADITSHLQDVSDSALFNLHSDNLLNTTTEVHVDLASHSSDASDSEDTSVDLELLRQNLSKLRESHRKRRNKRKHDITKLKDLTNNLQNRYEHEVHQREKEKQRYQRVVADREDETKRLRRDLADARKRLKDLSSELKALKQRVSAQNDLNCDICYEKVKCRVTKCGHGFCQDCLPAWFTEPRSRSLMDNGRHSCPTCRTVLCPAEDVWPLRLGRD